MCGVVGSSGLIVWLLVAVGGAGAEQDLVQPHGAATSLSCQLAADWEECRVEHLLQYEQRECVMLAGAEEQPCYGLGPGARLAVEEDRCRLHIPSLTDASNGSWVCRTRGVTVQVSRYHLTVLHPPSSVTVVPQTKQLFYLAGSQQWITARITVRNVAPMPVMQWSMHGESIDGLWMRETDVDWSAQYLTVVDSLYSTGKEAYNGQFLDYNLTLQVVDEFGHRNESLDYVNMGSIKLKCKNCKYAPLLNLTTETTSETFPTTEIVTNTQHMSTSTTTVTTSQTSTTTKSTTPIISTITTTTTSTPSLISTTTVTTTTTTTTSTTSITTTTPTSTTPGSSTARPGNTTLLPPGPCVFNLTEMSGEVRWPEPNRNCLLDPPPQWAVTIPCEGNCINNIKVNLKSVHSSSPDPCQTRLAFTAQDGTTLATE